MLSAKQDGIKYHFFSLWYDSTWDWTPVSRTIGERSTPKNSKNAGNCGRVRHINLDGPKEEELQCNEVLDGFLIDEEKKCVYIYIYVCMYVCVCACVCVC